MENSRKKASVFLCLSALGGVELIFGGLTRDVVVREDLLKDASDLCEVLSCKLIDHIVR